MRHTPDWLKIVLLPALLVSCNRSNPPAPIVRHYEVRGIVRGFAPDHTTVEIEHENIPGFMPSMTMPFRARDPKEIESLPLGQAIAFRLEVTSTDFFITDLRHIETSDVHLPQAAPTSTPGEGGAGPSPLREGDALPALHLTSEAGAPIARETLRGHPTVLTFIFTRCPMPNFCPRMSRDFAQLQKAIKSAHGPLAQTQLLSVTIDPQFDTPAVLKQYAQQEGADPRVWSFATGDPGEIDRLTRAFAVYRQTEGATISHGLTTGLIDREGKVTKLWRGNQWSPAEVLAAIEAKPPPGQGTD